MTPTVLRVGEGYSVVDGPLDRLGGSDAAEDGDAGLGELGGPGASEDRSGLHLVEDGAADPQSAVVPLLDALGVRGHALHGRDAEVMRFVEDDELVSGHERAHLEGISRGGEQSMRM